MNLAVRSTLDLLLDRACGLRACDDGLKVTVAQLALEDFATGLAWQRVVKDETLRDLETRETRFKKRRDVGWSRLCVRLGLDRRDQTFAELFVRYAEHRAIAHPRAIDQHVFDFGGVDVDAARDDHVALAVADEQKAVRIEEADVAACHEPAAIDLLSLVRPAMIGEIRIGPGAQKNLADAGRPDLVGILVVDPDFRTRHGPADRAGMGQPFRRIATHSGTGFRRTIGLVNDRAPPSDHLAFHIRRARRTGMGDPAHRGNVVALA